SSAHTAPASLAAFCRGSGLKPQARSLSQEPKSMPGLLGIITKNPNVEDARLQLSTMMRCMLHESFYTHGTYLLPELGCYLGWVNHRNSFSDCNPIINPTRDRVLIFSGEHHTHHDSASAGDSHSGYDLTNARYLLNLYETKGE